eukprot:gene13991-18762_t
MDSQNLNQLIKSSYAGVNEAESIGQKLGYKIDRDLSNRKHKVFIDENNKPIVAYTGTRTASDWLTDGALAVGLGGFTQRFKESKRVADKTRQKYGQPLTILGHSLGGSLAEHSGSKNDKIITVDKGVGVFGIGKNISKNQTDIRSANDPVSLLALTQKAKRFPAITLYLTSALKQLDSAFCANLQTKQCICVASNFMTGNIINSTDVSTRNILCSIPITTQPYSNIVYKNDGNKVQMLSALGNKVLNAKPNGVVSYPKNDKSMHNTLVINIGNSSHSVYIPTVIMIPKQLKYGDKVNSAMAQSYRTNIQPQNGTAITKNGTGGSAVWDACGAHGLIQRLRIFHGSNLLQDIDNYGLLAKMLFDLQVPTDGSYGRFNELAGTRNDLYTGTPTQVGTANATDLPTAQTLANALKVAFNANQVSANQINSGESYTIQANQTSPERFFCLNLISLLGTLSPAQYIPLFAMTTAPLRLELQLVSNANQAIASTSALTAIAVNKVEYIANFIKLSDGAMSVIYDSLGGQPLEFSLSDYANYQYTYNTITNGTTAQVNFAIPAKYSSLKSLFCTIRDQGTGTDTYFPFSSSVTGGIGSYYFRVGSQIMPTKAPDNLPEMFSELLKAMGSMSDLNYHPSIEKASYETASSTAITTANFKSISSGSFYIGIDLENYVTASKYTMFAGYNSNTDDIFAVISLRPTTGDLTNPRFDAFAMFDCTLTFLNGTCVRSF